MFSKEIMKSSKSSAFEGASGNPKLQKKVSFDVTPRAMNFARKSTGPHSRKPTSKLTTSKCRGLQRKCMHLQLKRVDISGYSVPRCLPVVDCECSDLYGCARLLPVDESLSSARTSVVRNQHWKKSFGSELSRLLKTRNKGVLKDVSSVLKGVLKHSSSPHCLSNKPIYKKRKMIKPVLHTSKSKSILKKGKSRKRKREPGEKSVKSSEAKPAVAAPSFSEVPSSSWASAEEEYELKLKETIEKMSEESDAKRRKVHEEVVKLPLEKIVLPTSCTLQVKTLSVTTSRGVQADRGFVVNEEVMDSLVSVKISESLYSMKERLHFMEEQLKKVTQEKLKMENILREKVQMIRELARNGFKPNTANKAVNTDSSNIDCEDKKASKVPVKRPKQQKIRSRHIATQTEINNQSICLKPMTSTSLKPYLQFRSASASPEPGVCEEEVIEENSKVEWMFHSTDTCARTHAMRSQVRLLRALKKNLGKHQLASVHQLQQCEDVIPDDIGWDSLGTEMQGHFIRLYKLMHLLKLLPVVDALKASSDRVSETLKHLLSHLPFPNSVTHTIDIRKIRQPRTDAMASYLFGWKLKEIVNVLRSVYFNKVLILPSYLKAEIVRADMLVYEHLIFAVQGIRNTTISHTTNSDADFLAGDTEVPMPDYCTKVCNLDSSDSCSDLSDDDESPVETPKQTRGVASREDSSSQKEQEESAKVIKRLTLKQLMSISDLVQSRIAKIKKMSLMPNPLRPDLPLTPTEPNPESFVDVASPLTKSSESISKSAEPKSVNPSRSSLSSRPVKPLSGIDGQNPFLQSVRLFMSHGISGPTSKSMASAVKPSSAGCSGSPCGIQGRLLSSPINQFTSLPDVMAPVHAVNPPSTSASDKVSIAHRLTWSEKGMRLASSVSLRPSETEADTMTCARVSAATPSSNMLVSKASEKTAFRTSLASSLQSSLSTSNSLPLVMPQPMQSHATGMTLRMPIPSQLQHALLASTSGINLSVADALKKSGIVLSRNAHSLQLKLLPESTSSVTFPSSTSMHSKPQTSMSPWTSIASSSEATATSSSLTAVVMTTTADKNDCKKGTKLSASMLTASSSSITPASLGSSAHSSTLSFTSGYSSSLACSSLSRPSSHPSPSSPSSSLSPASPTTLTMDVRTVISSAEPLETEDTHSSSIADSESSNLASQSQVQPCDSGSAATRSIAPTSGAQPIADTSSVLQPPKSGKQYTVSTSSGLQPLKSGEQPSSGSSSGVQPPKSGEQPSSGSSSGLQPPKSGQQSTVSTSLGLTQSTVSTSSDLQPLKCGEIPAVTTSFQLQKSWEQPTASFPLQPSVYSQVAGSSAMSALIFSRPTILSATREDTAVTIKWTFSSHLQPFVSKYAVFYAHKKTFVRDPQWRLIGYTESLALPMTCTLNQHQCINIMQECIFTISAVFVNGLTSQTSDPAIV